MSVVETPLLLPLAGDTLVGVSSEPAQATGRVGVVIVVGGPQFRVGSHRLFVRLARALAAGGYPTLRFDVRGMGDSTGARRSFEDLDADIDAAIAGLQRQCPQVERVVIWGLCDGASAALLYAHRSHDARIAGFALANPWVRSPDTLARATVKHYYVQRLRERDFWRKLAAGGVGLRAWREGWANLRQARRAPAGGAGFAELMARGWRASKSPVLLLLAGRDLTAQEFIEHAAANGAWQGLLHDRLVTRASFPDADHTFSASTQADAMIDATLSWLRRCFPGAAPAATP